MSVLLPICIMAHNEEKHIGDAICSALVQNAPSGYEIKVIVVANACTDRTEEIVANLVQQYPSKVELLSANDKGKTKAINSAISFMEQLCRKSITISYVVFLDADCQFLGHEVLDTFIANFKNNVGLSATSATCVPDVVFNSRTDLVSYEYRAIYEINKFANVNSISGMCYAIRFKDLIRVALPQFQFAEDMFVSSRLDGRFYKDPNIRIVFPTPPNIKSEIKRRSRQEVSSQRYRQYYAYLKSKRLGVKLFEQSIGDQFIWHGPSVATLLKAWMALKSARLQLSALIYLFVRFLAKLNAYKVLKQIKRHGDTDYWQVNR